MGQKVTIPISNGFYVSESLPLSHQQCINWYPNFPQAPSLSNGNLFGTPGLRQLTTTGDFSAEINRGALVKNEIPYFVNGETLYRLNSDFSTTSLGTVEGAGRVSMAENGTQLCILSPGGKGYIYNENAGTPFQEITDVDFRANGEPQYVVFIDGYFLFTTDEKKFIISALNDGLSYTATDFGTAEADPDRVVAPLVHDNTVFIFGSETFEAFQNIGGSGFPFQRIQGSVISKGLFAAFSAIQSSTAFYWIGGSTNEDPAIWRSNGGEPVKISTTAIDFALGQFSDSEIDRAYALTFGQDGATFVVFTVGNTTFKFNLDEQLPLSSRWHEQKSTVNEQLRPWRAASIVKGYSLLLAGDAFTGKIGAVERTTYKEYGGTIFRRFSVQPISNQSDSFSLPKIELTTESGVGDNETPDPQIRMRVSRDAKKFRDSRSRSLGKIGEFERRSIWRRNGRFPRMAVLEWTMSDPVKPTILRMEPEFS